MDEDETLGVLKLERLGHEEAGMSGVYGHVSDTMRQELKSALETRWQQSLLERAQISLHSAFPLLDELLSRPLGCAAPAPISLPKIGHRTR